MKGLYSDIGSRTSLFLIAYKFNVYTRVSNRIHHLLQSKYHTLKNCICIFILVVIIDTNTGIACYITLLITVN